MLEAELLYCEKMHHVASPVARTHRSALYNKCSAADDALPSFALAGSGQNQLGVPVWTRSHANGALARGVVPGVNVSSGRDEWRREGSSLDAAQNKRA